jgi:hypothetical protein
VARAAALADINLIRVNSGGLAPIAVDPGVGGTGTGDLLLDELLYNKRYSLWAEGGHSWIDFRRYNKLNLLPHDLPNEKVFPYYPLVDAECTIRTPTPAGCTPVDGI